MPEGLLCGGYSCRDRVSRHPSMGPLGQRPMRGLRVRLATPGIPSLTHLSVLSRSRESSRREGEHEALVSGLPGPSVPYIRYIKKLLHLQ
jgi:hypothetical protein